MLTIVEQHNIQTNTARLGENQKQETDQIDHFNYVQPQASIQIKIIRHIFLLVLLLTNLIIKSTRVVPTAYCVNPPLVIAPLLIMNPLQLLYT